MNQSRSLISIVLIFLSILLVGGLLWADYHFARFNVSGEGFSIQWISIQALAKGGSDPYSNQVTAQIQASVARETAFVEESYPKYTSPLFSGVVIFPFTLIGEKNLAHAVWMSAQLIAILAVFLICTRLCGWKPAWYIYAVFGLFTIFSYHILLPWLDGGLSVWAALFLALALSSINANRNEAGGVFLALAAIQPQMVILPILFILIWAVSKKRSVLILWFFITLILLSVVVLFLVPGWIIQYARLIYNFSSNFPPGTPGIFFSQTWPGLGKQLGWLVSGLAILFMAFEWILAAKKDFRWFLWTVCLTMVISQWIGIPTIPANFVDLIIPLILVFSLLTERWRRGGQWASIILSAALFVWEWALFYLDLMGSEPAFQINLLFPLPAILLVGLYWVRWWAIKPRRLLIEELRLSETF